MEKVFRKRYKGPESGDCTAPYTVELTGQPTVGEMVAQILEAGNEWGFITINTDDGSVKECAAKFNKSTIDTGAIAWAMGRKVLRAAASGGWGRMDYEITVFGDYALQD